MLPEDLQLKWSKLRAEFVLIEKIKINRWMDTFHTHSKFKYELHRFADSTEEAYAATTYLRVMKGDGSFSVHLVAAKTKVAPIKRIALPRLELCAAHLLVKLVNSIRTALKLSLQQIVLWTDSTVTLAWIRGHPIRWKTFVANKVTEIQESFPTDYWRHVPSGKNAADCASRGLMPSELIKFEMWWKGPEFLQQDESQWPMEKKRTEFVTDAELRKQIALSTHVLAEPNPILHQFEDLDRLSRITAYCMRVFNKENRPSSKVLSVNEVQQSLIFWIKHTQKIHFSDEIRKLSANKAINTHSSILSLRPFLDGHGIVRVGGRLGNAAMAYDRKHPILLPATGHLVKLVIHESHQRSLHGGCQLALNIVRQKYWIIHGRSAVRSYIKSCVRCARFATKPTSQLMADLPAARIQQSRIFIRIGLDYAGPYDLRTSGLRNAATIKGYIAIFVCFSTKAIHLECVTGLTTDAFLLAFKRFVSRRGKPSHCHSDQGTNFVGAVEELEKMFNMSTTVENEIIRHALLKDGVQWVFNPPSAPHFGGLWEAGVKSVKHHLRRSLGESKLTYEGMSTVLAQIEACLNSRPLYAVTADIDDVSALTPGHFIIGAPMVTLPEPNLLEINSNRLDHYQYLQRLYQSFWSRYHEDYLNTLQQRSKWREVETNLKIGDVVIIKEDNLPPAKWILGVILEAFPDKNGLVRTAKVKTATTCLMRPVQKLCRLPLHNEEDRSYSIKQSNLNK